MFVLGSGSREKRNWGKGWGGEDRLFYCTGRTISMKKL
jgi:hypothetical protein